MRASFERVAVHRPLAGRLAHDVLKWRLVELRGIEPLTSAVRLQRSPI